ncbi:rCG36857, partial [Rattus norvegicus]
MGHHSHSDEILWRELYFQSKDFHQNKNLFC